MAKIILITGTSSGFGKLAAELLAASGYKIYATMRDIGGRNATVARELRARPNITVLPLEMADTKSNHDAVAAVVAKEGRIDVLINNAGSFFLGIGESFTEQDLLQIYDVDVLGPWRLIRAVLPHMRRQNEGFIISVSSSLARFSCPFMTAYASGKHALEGLLHGMKHELKGFNIDISFIEPGIFPTEIFNKSRRGSDASVNSAYGPLAGIADQIKRQLDEMFRSGHGNDPGLVPQAMLKLIETPAGKRPIRVPVDPNAGEITDRVNSVHAEEYAKFLTASGMGGLL